MAASLVFSASVCPFQFPIPVPTPSSEPVSRTAQPLLRLPLDSALLWCGDRQRRRGMLPATHRRVCCTSGSPGGLEETEPAAAENVAPIGVPALAGHAVSPLAPPMAVADMGATASVAILVEIAAAAVPEVAAAIWGLGPPVIRTCLAGPMVATPRSVRRESPLRQTGAEDLAAAAACASKVGTEDLETPSACSTSVGHTGCTGTKLTRPRTLPLDPLLAQARA